jgi:four helix bundle protein
MMPFERLEAWRASHELVLAVYQTTDRFPKHELYGLTSQIRRAAVSIAANIAEGAAKRGTREFRRFLDISLGSFSELTYLLLLSKDLDYLGGSSWDELSRLRERAGKLLWTLYKSMGRRR